MELCNVNSNFQNWHAMKNLLDNSIWSSESFVLHFHWFKAKTVTVEGNGGMALVRYVCNL